MGIYWLLIDNMGIYWLLIDNMGIYWLLIKIHPSALSIEPKFANLISKKDTFKILHLLIDWLIVVPRGFWDFSSPTRDETQNLSSESAES